MRFSELHNRRNYLRLFTAIVSLLITYNIGRNIIYTIGVQREVNLLRSEIELYRERISADSATLQMLEHNHYLEKFAREHHHMQATNEDIYIIKELPTQKKAKKRD